MDLKQIMQGGAKLIHRVTLEGIEHVPADGRIVVASNHAGVRGALLLGSLLKRDIAFVVSARFFKFPVVASMARRIGGVFVTPFDMFGVSMIDRCAQVLDQGSLLGIMTEGRMMRLEYGPPKRGAAYLAARLGACLLPVSVRLNGPLASVRIFAPMAPPPAVDRQSLDRVTQRLARTLESGA